MTLTLEAIPVPLVAHDDGTIRIGKTRVLLEAFIWAFREEHLTPDELITSWPVLSEREVYAVLAYYAANREAVDAYVQDQADEVERIANLPEYQAQRGRLAEIKRRATGRDSTNA